MGFTDDESRLAACIVAMMVNEELVELSLTKLLLFFLATKPGDTGPFLATIVKLVAIKALVLSDDTLDVRRGPVFDQLASHECITHLIGAVQGARAKEATS